MRVFFSLMWCSALVLHAACLPGLQHSLDDDAAYNAAVGQSCTWSVECPESMICLEDGTCGLVPDGDTPNGTVINGCYAFSPNPDLNFDAIASNNEEQASSHTVPQNLSYTDYVNAVTEPGGILDQELQQAIAQRDALQEHIATEQGIRDTLHTYALVHEAKTSLRRFLSDTENYVQSTTVGWPDSTTLDAPIVRCQSVLEEFWETETHERSEALKRGANSCIQNTYHLLLSSLDNIQGTANFEHIPLQALKYSRDLAVQSLGETSEDWGWDWRCADYARLRELPYALSEYTHIIRYGAQVIADSYPITDVTLSYMDAPGGSALRKATLGQTAVELHPVIDDDTVRIGAGGYYNSPERKLELFRDYVVDALRQSRSAFENIALRTPQVWLSNIEVSAYELAPITLLSDQFLRQRPEFVELTEHIVADLDRRYEGIGIAGTGCLLFSVVAMTGAAPAAIIAAPLCMAEFVLSLRAALITQQLYRQAKTYRFFGVESSLESHDRVRALAASHAIEWAVVMATAVGSAFDVLFAYATIHKILRNRKQAMLWMAPTKPKNESFHLTHFHSYARMREKGFSPKDHRRLIKLTRKITRAEQYPYPETLIVSGLNGAPRYLLSPEELTLLAQGLKGTIGSGNRYHMFGYLLTATKEPFTVVPSLTRSQITAFRTQVASAMGNLGISFPFQYTPGLHPSLYTLPPHLSILEASSIARNITRAHGIEVLVGTIDEQTVFLLGTANNVVVPDVPNFQYLLHTHPSLPSIGGTHDVVINVPSTTLMFDSNGQIDVIARHLVDKGVVATEARFNEIANAWGGDLYMGHESGWNHIRIATVRGVHDNFIPWGQNALIQTPFGQVQVQLPSLP